MSSRLSDRAYEEIRAELLRRGTSAFGGLFTEQQIADQLELSRTPVRDALQRLCLKGWLEELPAKGFRPVPSRIGDVFDAFELRILLEPLAAMLAARDPRASVSATATAERPGSAQELSFHLRVARAGGVEVLENAIDEVAQIPVMSQSGGGNVHFGDDHAVIADAINRGHEDLAQEAMVEHLCRVRLDRLRSLARTRTDAR